MVEELVCLMGSPYLSSFPTIVWTGYACSGVSSSAYRRRGVLRPRTRGQGAFFGGGGGWRFCSDGARKVTVWSSSDSD